MPALAWRAAPAVLLLSVLLAGCLEVAPRVQHEAQQEPAPVEATLLGTQYPWVAPQDAENPAALENASVAGVLIRFHNKAPMGMAKVENLTLTFVNGTVIRSRGYLIVQSDRSIVASIGAGRYADKREVHQDLVEIRFDYHFNNPTSTVPIETRGTVTLKGPAAP